MEPDTSQDKYVLITNLQYVTIGPVRTNAYALLLEERVEPFALAQSGVPSPRDRDESFTWPKRYTMRGFGADSAWPVFNMIIPTIGFTAEDAEGGPICLDDDDKLGVAAITGKPRNEPRRLASGAVLQITGGPAVELVVCDHEQPLSIEHFDGVSIAEVWDALPVRVAKYWRWPNMPTLQWMPSAHVRQYYTATYAKRRQHAGKHDDE